MDPNTCNCYPFCEDSCPLRNAVSPRDEAMAFIGIHRKPSATEEVALSSCAMSMQEDTSYSYSDDLDCAFSACVSIPEEDRKPAAVTKKPPPVASIQVNEDDNASESSESVPPFRFKTPEEMHAWLGTSDATDEVADDYSSHLREERRMEAVVDTVCHVCF